MFLKPTLISYLPGACCLTSLVLSSTMQHTGSMRTHRSSSAWQKDTLISQLLDRRNIKLFFLDTAQTVVHATQKLCIICCVYAHLNMQSYRITDWTVVSAVVGVVACLKLISVTRQQWLPPHPRVIQPLGLLLFWYDL